MKRDMELVRDVLKAIEEFPFDGGFHEINIEGRSESEISYHVMILHKAGLIEAIDLSTHDGMCWKAKTLSYHGHEFLDAARSDTVWAKAKAMLLNSTGTLTLEALKQALPLAMKGLLPG